MLGRPDLRARFARKGEETINGKQVQVDGSDQRATCRAGVLPWDGRKDSCSSYPGCVHPDGLKTFRMARLNNPRAVGFQLAMELNK